MGFGADIGVDRRFADFAYDMKTGRRILLENQIETNETVFVDALGYLSIFDLLFPKLVVSRTASLSMRGGNRAGLGTEPHKNHQPARAQAIGNQIQK